METADVKPQPTDTSTINYADWQSRGADALAVGSVSGNPDGSLKVNFRLYDPVQNPAGGMSYSACARPRCAPPHTALPT